MIDEYGVTFLPDGSSLISPVLMSSRRAAFGSSVTLLISNPRRLIVACDSGLGGAGESAIAGNANPQARAAIGRRMVVRFHMAVLSCRGIEGPGLMPPSRPTEGSAGRPSLPIADT